MSTSPAAMVAHNFTSHKSETTRICASTPARGRELREGEDGRWFGGFSGVLGRFVGSVVFWGGLGWFVGFSGVLGGFGGTLVCGSLAVFWGGLTVFWGSL